MACGRSALPATRYWPFRRLAGEKDSGRPANRDGCEFMLPGRGYGRCNIIMGQEDDMTGVTLQRAYGHSIPVLSAAMAGVLVAGANVSRRACVLERAHRQEAVDGVQLCRRGTLGLKVGRRGGRSPKNPKQAYACFEAPESPNLQKSQNFQTARRAPPGLKQA